MQLADFRFLHRLRVRWGEVDAQQIVFFPHYLTYCNAASADYWRAVGFPLSSFASLDGDLHVRKITLEYHDAAQYDDELDIGLRCARVGNSSLTYALGIFRGAQLLVGGEMISVFAARNARRAMRVPDVLRTAIEAFEASPR